VSRRNPSVWRDTVYKTDLLNAILKIKVITRSYLHITSSPQPYTRSSKEAIENVRKLIRGIEDPDQIINALIRSGVIKAYTGSYFEQFKLNGKPVIPGSSLKGAIRSRLELLAMESNGVNIACFIRSSYLRSIPNVGQHGWRHTRIWGKTVLENRGRTCDATRWGVYEDINVCKTCDLFGTSGLISRIDFSTLYPTVQNAMVELNVFFSCDHRRIVGGVVEAIKPSTVFEGEIAVHGLSDSEFGLLAIGLRLHEEGNPILTGRFKYRRLAVCEDNAVKPVVFGRLEISPLELRLPITHKKYLEKHGIEYERVGHSCIVKGDDLVNYIKYAVEEAYKVYGKYLPRDFDEIRVLEEQVWAKEREWWNNCICGKR